MIGTQRFPSAQPANAYFPGGTWEYRRNLTGAPEGSGDVVAVEFEGVYRDAVVSVNGVIAGRRPHGYSWFTVPIDHLLHAGDENELRVEARAGDDSRWYSGAGIHRSVWLLRSGPVHLVPNGLAVRTPEIDDQGAVVTVAGEVRNRSTVSCQPTLRVELVDADGAIVAGDDAPVTTFPGQTVTVRRRLFVGTPRRWRLDDPYLYQCRMTLLAGTEVLDDDVTTFGIRPLAVDPQRGLRVNGEPVLLRGACVHHDNGPLGAVAIPRAEERRVELLKAAGFNAIRSSHNPMSRAMLDACDRLGMLVMDETFDVWAQTKSDDDYARHFAEWWEADVEAMVRNDQNHACVVMYSIGNEIPDGSTPTGLHLGRALPEQVRGLDDTRFVTQAVSGLLVGGDDVLAEIRRAVALPPSEDVGVNTAATTLGDLLRGAMRASVVDEKTAEAFAHLDVAGYIGDFTWTGWDYLGEAGIGRTEYSADPDAPGMSAFHGPYPWLAAWCGDIDITGRRRPQSYYRETVFGLRTEPYIAVLRPEHHGRVVRHAGPWSWSDVVSSWSWPGHEGTPVAVEVYAGADEVELLLDGTSLGRQPAGAPHRFRAAFEVTYEPGELEAVGWRGGEIVGRTSLRTASGPVLLDARADRAQLRADASDLAFVELSLVDSSGTVHTTQNRRIEVEVDGPGVLQAVGNANPKSEEPFTGSGCTTFDGRALAIVRPTGPGAIAVTATAEGCEPQHVRIDAR